MLLWFSVCAPVRLTVEIPSPHLPVFLTTGFLLPPRIYAEVTGCLWRSYFFSLLAHFPSFWHWHLEVLAICLAGCPTGSFWRLLGAYFSKAFGDLTVMSFGLTCPSWKWQGCPWGSMCLTNLGGQFYHIGVAPSTSVTPLMGLYPFFFLSFSFFFLLFFFDLWVVFKY
jgi:hypothetical protein